MLVPESVRKAKLLESAGVRTGVALGATQWFAVVEKRLPLLSTPGPLALSVSSPGTTRSGLMRASSNEVPRLEKVATL